MKIYTNITIIIMIWVLMEIENQDSSIKGHAQVATKSQRINIKKYILIKINIQESLNILANNKMMDKIILML